MIIAHILWRFMNNVGQYLYNLKKFYVDKGKMPQAEADAVLGRIRSTTSLK